MTRCVFLLVLYLTLVHGKFLPSWDSLDKRPLPKWYDEAKIGIFIHWGVFSVPSFGSEWFWHHWRTDGNPEYQNFMLKNYKPNFKYQDFARDFTAEFFNPREWAELFKSSGARYVVLTSKHHEGFTLWPSKYSYSWNAGDVGPGRDLVGELAEAVREKGLHFGLYHSLYEWYNPLWQRDKARNFSSNEFVNTKVLPEMRELVNTYRPDVLWSDGSQEASDTYWGSTKFLAWLYNSSPVRNSVVTNDRWGSDTACKHGGFFTCQDRYNPGVLQHHKWENAMTLDRKSWGFRREARLADFLSFEDLITELMSTVSCGGNLLVNVGPTREGTITPVFEERLRRLGAWLAVNGEAVYSSHPWTYQNETIQHGVWYTKRGDNVYVTALKWPNSGLLTLHRPIIGHNNSVTLLGYSGTVKWQTAGVGTNIKMPDLALVTRPLPWVFKFTNITN